MSTGLSERVARLERALPPSTASNVCPICGLPHIRLPVPIALVEAIVRRALDGQDVEVPRLCLCTTCCAAGADIARLTHGRPPREGTTWWV